MRVFIDAPLLIYLNIPLEQDEEKKIENFYRKLLKEELFTDMLVIDEVIYVSKKKYKIPINETIDFFDQAVLPFIRILPITEYEYVNFKKYILKYNLKPSDAIHLSVIDNNKIQVIVTEDREFDKTHIKRLWIE